MNKVMLTGRLTKDAELSFLPSTGTAVAKFSIAVDDYNFATKTKGAQFFNIVVWGKQAENVASYTGKGSLIAVIGSLKNREYTDKNGVKRYPVEVHADMRGGVNFLSSKKTSGEGNGNYNQNQGNGNYNKNQGNGNYNQGNNNYNQNQNSNPANDAYAGAFGGFDDTSDFTPIDDGDMPF